MSRSIAFPVRRLALFSFLLAATALMSACNTVDGMGRDVRAGGEAIEDTFD